MSTWPSTLPIPTAAGYGLETADQTARTDMESGPARVRRRSTASPDQISLRFVFDANQMAIFRTFWESDFLFGAAWVMIPIKDGRAVGVVNKECRPSSAKFSAAPLSASHWAVEFKVEVRNA